jgi:hypothetical protein
MRHSNDQNFGFAGVTWFDAQNNNRAILAFLPTAGVLFRPQTGITGEPIRRPAGCSSFYIALQSLDPAEKLLRSVGSEKDLLVALSQSLVFFKRQQYVSRAAVARDYHRLHERHIAVMRKLPHQIDRAYYKIRTTH